MPLLSPPYLIGISSTEKTPKHSISFSYNWVGDTVKTINLAGVSFQGSSYTLDVSSLPTTVAKLPAFRTLQITQSFKVNGQTSGDAVYNTDGGLLVSVSGTGQIMRFGWDSHGGIPITGNMESIVTAMVPIVANSPTKITFAKQINVDPSAVENMYGVLTVSIFDFDLPPYFAQGFGTSN